MPASMEGVLIVHLAGVSYYLLHGLTVLSMTPLHFLGQHNSNEVQDGIMVIYAIAVASVSHDANSVINGTIPFLRSITIKIRCNMNFLDSDTTAS